MILLVDNYDSFTYNVYQYLRELGASVRVRRNDVVTVKRIRRSRPKGIVLSPGPGRPEEAGACMDLVREFAPRIPILGICLGHQAIAAAFGGRIIGAPRLVHGKTSLIQHDQKGIFRNLKNPLEATRYHSLVVDGDSIPDCLEISARTDDGVIMGIRHRRFPVEGVQFHPESILTEAGRELLNNFLGVAG